MFTFLGANDESIPIVDWFASRPPDDQAPIVLLAPGGQAVASVSWSNWCGARSRPWIRRVRLTLGNGAGRITLPESGAYGEF